MYRRKDPFYQRAKETGYRSRAAFKLEELRRRFRVCHPGDFVVDLGAWPGGWLQVASRAVGAAGRVIGVDLLPIDPFPGATNVTTVRADIGDPATLIRLQQLAPSGVDVILSDLAPKLTGIRDRDASQAQRLASQTLQLAQRLLRRNGALIIKLFMSEEVPAYLDCLRTAFVDVSVTRPQATRKGSAEIYAVAKGLIQQI